ncbi:hypothetical protein Tco_0115799 [Tanacetum coccineum]
MYSVLHITHVVVATVRNSAGIDNEAASSMTRVAKDDETQRNKQKPIGVSQFTKNFDVWEFGTVLRWHYGKDHGNAVEDRQYEVDFAMGITGIFCCKSGRSCEGAEAIQSNELLSTKGTVISNVAFDLSHSRQKDLKATVKNHRHVKIKIRKGARLDEADNDGGCGCEDDGDGGFGDAAVMHVGVTGGAAVIEFWSGEKKNDEVGYEVGFVCTMAEIGCNWARIGPSKSSQSLSIAHKWAVVILRAHLVFTVFINILLGFPGPSDGLRLHSIVFFSSGSGLTADSSVLTLTLAFLDFGLDFAQSFPFHAQFCHFGLVFCLFDDIHFLHNTNAKQTYIWQFLSVFGHLSSFLETYLVETETPESPHTVVSPTPLLDSTPPKRHAEDSVDSETSGARPTSSDFTTPLSPDHPLTHASPTLVPILRRTTRMAVRVPPAMSPGLSASIEKVVAMSNSTFHKSRDKEEEEEDDEEDDEYLS